MLLNIRVQGQLVVTPGTNVCREHFVNHWIVHMQTDKLSLKTIFSKRPDDLMK